MTLITLRDVGVAYDGYEALEHVDLEIGEHDFLGVIGPNGGGKTTLVKAILGTIPHSGTIRYAPELFRGGERLIGYMPQISDFDRAFPISLCRAVIADPKLLILDEPANFVDNRFEKELYRTLQELNRRMAVVIVSHDIGTITSVVKEIVCVNRRAHRHRSNILTEEQLRNYDCPIQLVSHGHIPHTVLEHHPGDGCCDHDSVR